MIIGEADASVRTEFMRNGRTEWIWNKRALTFDLIKIPLQPSWTESIITQLMSRLQGLSQTCYSHLHERDTWRPDLTLHLPPAPALSVSDYAHLQADNTFPWVTASRWLMWGLSWCENWLLGLLPAITTCSQLPHGRPYNRSVMRVKRSLWTG